MRFTFATALACVLLLPACAGDDAPPAAPGPEIAAAPDELQVDPVSGLIMAGDWQLVRAACTACHSGKQITQQRGTAEQWLSMIRWMQKKQNLWEFDPVTEGKIVAYLAENYPPRAAQRRAALSAELMPPNPYGQ